MKAALILLLEAHDAAIRLEADRWDFAVEIHALKEAGLGHSDLRTLVCQGLADHRVERTGRGAARRTFAPPRSLRLQRASCFTLSESGLLLAREHAATAEGPGDRMSQAGVSGLQESQPCLPGAPHWDTGRRELRLGDMVVKRFRRPARSQETILAAFQEEGWPPHIDNPLASRGDTEAIDRLHDAVKKLNRQTRSGLRFFSDGTGQGVLWEFAGALAPSKTPRGLKSR